jgi:hypothetical protein
MPYLTQTNDIISQFPTDRKRGEYRIAIVGNSYVDRVLPPEDAIGATVQGRLQPLLAARHERLTVYAHGVPGIGRDDALATVDEALSSGLADVVVLDLPMYFNVPGVPDANRFPERWDDGWIERTRRRLRELTRELAKNGVSFYVYAHPQSYEMPGEMVYRQFPQFPLTGTSQDDEAHIPDPADVARVRAAIASLAFDPELNFIDLYPALFGERAAADSRPIYNSWDHHFTAFGASLVGNVLADRLAKDAPWAHR